MYLIYDQLIFVGKAEMTDMISVAPDMINMIKLDTNQVAITPKITNAPTKSNHTAVINTKRNSNLSNIFPHHKIQDLSSKRTL